MALNTKKMEEQVFDEPRFEFLLYVILFVKEVLISVIMMKNSQMLLSLMRLDNFRV
jgi:hypothetical protein